VLSEAKVLFSINTTAQLMFSQNIDALFWEHRCSREHLDVPISEHLALHCEDSYQICAFKWYGQTF